MLRRLLLAAITAATLTTALAAPTLAATPSVKGGKFEVTCKPHAIPDQAISRARMHVEAELGEGGEEPA